MPPEIIAVEGDGDRPVPGDVLSSPFLVLDDVAEQLFERAPGGRVYRRAGSESRLVGIQVDEAGDLGALTDTEAAGLRGIEFDRWDPAIARELARVDARRCLFEFGPLKAPVDLASLPRATRYLDMRHAQPVDPVGFARFAELRYLAVPREPFLPEGVGPLPPPEDMFTPGPAISATWVPHLPELRWLDLEGVAGDLRPLAGHPRLRVVLAAHCAITGLPAECMPELREFRAPFSDCPDAEVERMRHLHPDARILTTAREVLLDRIGAATRLQLRHGIRRPNEPNYGIVFASEDRTEIGGLLNLLQPRRGYERHSSIPGANRGVLQFFAHDGTPLGEVGIITAGILRCDQAWSLMPAVLASDDDASALAEWFATRGLEIRD